MEKSKKHDNSHMTCRNSELSKLETFFKELRQRDFPSLTPSHQKKPAIYLDSAATSLKPRQVIDCIHSFYLYEYGTVHRGVYAQSIHATELYEKAREISQKFINASDSREIIFTRGTTDGINIIADSLVHTPSLLDKGQTILVSAMEHHSNFVPWQMAAERSGASFQTIPLQGDKIDLNTLETLLQTYKVALVAVAHASNILGTVNPIKDIAQLCQKYGALLVVDGAQAAPHMRVDVQELGCDFYAFSSHKISGPTGAGVLWGRKELFEKLSPPRGGGDMIDKVTFTSTTYAQPPLKFEPGTPPIAEIIGMARAIEYMENECGGIEAIALWEKELTRYLREKLLSLSPRIRLIGNETNERGALQSFMVEGSHPLDIATLLDLEGVAIRSGHMCGQPLLSLKGVSSLLRASCAYYNTINDIDAFITALSKVIKMV